MCYNLIVYKNPKNCVGGRVGGGGEGAGVRQRYKTCVPPTGNKKSAIILFQHIVVARDDVLSN